MSLPNYYDVDYLKCTNIDENELEIINNYTMTAYIYINAYLRNIDTISTYKMFNTNIFLKYFKKYINTTKNKTQNNIIKNVNSKLSINTNSNLDWFRRIMYMYIYELYTIIKKCIIKLQPFRVYRGTPQHYLKEDRDKYYYINIFTSTSTEKDTALSFTNSNTNNALYIFYVQPGVEYIYIGEIEDELLLNIYNKCLFIKKDNDRIPVYHYLLLPSIIQLPSSYNTFKIFKQTIINRTETIRGGRMNTNKKTRKQRNYINRTRKNYIHTVSNSSLQDRIKQLRDKEELNNHGIETARQRFRRLRQETRQELGLPEETDEERMENFRRRMDMPIGISQGFPVTPEMREQVEEIKRLFNL
jgi:hypothetical protein